MRKFTSLFLPISFFLAAFTFAETPVYDENEAAEYPISGFYFSVGRANFDSDIAEQERIEDSSTFLRAMWEGQKGQLVYGAGVGMYLYSDNEGFTQWVEDSFGNTDRAKSSASGFTAIGEVGYAKALNENIALEALGGVELMLSSERGIDNCSNCYEQDIDIDGGMYLMPRLRISSTGSFNFSISYQHFLSGDIESAIAANFSWRQ